MIRAAYFKPTLQAFAFTIRRISYGETYAVGKIGHLSNGSVTCKIGGTVIHSVVCSATPLSDVDGSLPLTTEYRSRQYAFGLIPDNMAKRERHGSEEETIVSRFIDRSIRPCFPAGFLSEVQVTVTNHAADGENDPTTAAINATSVALQISGLPWEGPVGCVRVGCVDGKLVVNPSVAIMAESSLNLLYASNARRPVMIEASAMEIPEALLKEALVLAHSAAQSNILKQLEFVSANSPVKTVHQVQKDVVLEVPPDLQAFVESVGLVPASDLFREGRPDKAKRGKGENEINQSMLQAVYDNPAFKETNPKLIKKAVNSVMKKAFRNVVLEGRRADGRGLSEVRPIDSVPGYLPTVHGSAFFMRGDTHVLCTATLGSRQSAKNTQPVDGAAPVEKHFFLHYDFPPYCTGSVGNASALNRRMIGHGNLAERAVAAIMPKFSDFPYTVRVFSECTSSSGSSSMASVCGASLCLMDAGVPIATAVAGLSIGLITEEDFNDENKANKSYTLLTDIIGSEDYFGDMDFKIAGSKNGVTAIQLDTKLFQGVPLPILLEALDKAREGRLHILSSMNSVIESSRPTIRDNAPSAEVVRYDPDRKRHLIGPGGEMVNFIQQSFQCDIDTQTEGIAYIYGKDKQAVAQARDLVQDLVVVVKEGDLLTAEVREVKDFGAIVKITRAQDALLHMSEISYSPDVAKKPLKELMSVGQRLNVKVLVVDKATGQISVSRKKALDPKAPDTLTAQDIKATRSGMQDLPTFPVLPPRMWSADYFRNGVASAADVSRALKRASE